MPRILILISILLTTFMTACDNPKAETKTTNTPQYVQTQSEVPDKKVLDEEEAQAVLDTARLALHAGGFETARAKTKSIRTRFPHALNAREDAILLLDSIEIMEAASKVTRLDATGSVETDESIAVERAKAADKVEFFQEKLARDIAARKTH